MKGVLRASAALVLAAAAGATTFVNEDFEGTFPPTGWKKECSNRGNWTRGTGGPWGPYASGSTYSAESGLSRAALFTLQFNVRAEMRLSYRFDYGHFDVGHQSYTGALFYIAYQDQPPGTPVYVKLSKTSGWKRFSGEAVFYRAGPVKATWAVWCENTWRYGYSYLRVDNVLIADKPSPAVAPASLGRVRALFR